MRRQLLGCAGIAIVAILILAGAWYRRVQERTEVLAAELRQARQQWTVASARLGEARGVRASLDKFALRVAEVQEACNRFDGAAALVRGMLDSEAAGVDLREVRVQQVADDPPAWSVRIVGQASGAKPRALADSFRRKAAGEMERRFGAEVGARFETLGDLPGAKPTLGGEQNVGFTILATVKMPGALAQREG